MVVAQILAALQPFALPIAGIFLAFLGLVELRGVIRRAGTTARRSSSGTAVVLFLVALTAIGLVVEGYSAYGGPILAVLVIVLAAWAVLGSGHSGRKAAGS